VSRGFVGGMVRDGVVVVVLVLVVCQVLNVCLRRRVCGCGGDDVGGDDCGGDEWRCCPCLVRYRDREQWYEGVWFCVALTEHHVVVDRYWD